MSTPFWFNAISKPGPVSPSSVPDADPPPPPPPPSVVVSPLEPPPPQAAAPSTSATEAPITTAFLIMRTPPYKWIVMNPSSVLVGFGQQRNPGDTRIVTLPPIFVHTERDRYRDLDPMGHVN